MAKIDFRIHVLLQQFVDSDSCGLGEALFFPETTTAETNPDDVREIVLENILRQLPEIPGSQLWQRMHAGILDCVDIELQIEPAERSPLWREPVSLTLYAVRWQKSADLHLALLPSLGMEVAANTAEELLRAVEEQVRLEIFRRKAARSLGSMLQLSRCSGLTLQGFDISHTVESPKDRAQRELQPRTPEARVLDKACDRLQRSTAVQAWCREGQVQQLAELLGGRVPRSVLLVGPSGSGKTAIFRELAIHSASHDFSTSQFWMTSGSRLVAGMTGFGMWQERLERLRQEMQESRVILHVGSLMELVETGRSNCQTEGMAAFLRPFIARGEMLVAAECTPEELSVIERQDAALVRAFVQLTVTEPPQSDRLRILTEAAREQHPGATLSCSPAAIAEIERLHRRFATYSAFPARQLRFLQNLRRDLAAAGDPAPGHLIAPEDVVTTFSQETGLPLWMLDDRIPFAPAAAEHWFATRVIGQAEAVDLTVNLLTTLKAQLNREHRPLASLLLIGPTGVGKTELARAIAEYMFGAADAADSRMIRIDMSEYADPLAAERLIGGSAASEGLLTARIREQPFSVVLLDEFEKADSAIFDLLLQVLGEGRLTDAAGRLADFRNSIIIMTSNLGAAGFGRGAAGFSSSPADLEDARRHFEREVRSFVRPELFNRIDRIVPFAPLDRATARRIVERQLKLVREREGLKYRRVSLSYNDDVVDYLLERGFEPRYGARSLRRVIDRDFLAPLAEQFNQYSADTVLTAVCSVAKTEAEAGPPGLQLQHVIHAETDAVGRVLSTAGAANADLFQAVEQLQFQRASLQQLRQASSVLSLESRIFRLEKQERRWNRNPTHSGEELQLRQELERLRLWLGRCDACLASISGREEQELLTLYGGSAAPDAVRSLREFLHREQLEFEALLMDLLELETAARAEIRMLLVSDDASALQLLTRSFLEIAAGLAARVAVWEYLPAGVKRTNLPADQWSLKTLRWTPVPAARGSSGDDKWQLQLKDTARASDNAPLLLRRRVADGRPLTDPSTAGVPGRFLEIRGPRVFNRFVREEGVHRFDFGQGKVDVQVFTGLPEIDQYLPPAGILRPGAVLLTDRCRDYDFSRERIVDRWLAETVTVPSTNDLPAVLSTLLARRHRQLAEQLLD